MSEQLNAENFSSVSNWVLNPEPQIPDSALKMAGILLLDTLGVAIAAQRLEVAAIANEFASDFLNSGNSQKRAPLLIGAGEASLAGAAWATATALDNLDGHDGYNPTKGHIGCAVVPGLLAFAYQQPALSGRDALIAMTIAYEVAARAGIALHNTVTDYHTSGAWNGLGVAALGCRLRNTTSEVLRQALGIAEYHGPRSQMMREIAHPTMLHDGSGMGALVGAQAVLLAQRGFQGAPAITLEAENAAPYWQDLGEFWTVEHNYIKPYPICRWAHAALDALWLLQQEHGFSVDQVSQVEINTFHEAAQLYPNMPDTTSQAQYSLPFAVANLLRFGRVGVEHISGEALSDPQTADVLTRIKVKEAKRHSERFPVGRWSDVVVTLQDGQQLASGDVHARGGPEAPMSEQQVIDKFMDFTQPILGAERAGAVVGKALSLHEESKRFSELSELIYAVV